jgi:hypothetical protein
MIYFKAVWNISRPFDTFCGQFVYVFCGHLVCFSRFSMLYQEKFGNTGHQDRFQLSPKNPEVTS